jgi:hypothetical protein
MTELTPCFDKGCPQRNDCARFQDAEPEYHDMPSLRSYEDPLSDPCEHFVKNFLAVGADELGNPVGEFYACECGEIHPVLYAEEVLMDGTKIPSKLMAYYKCGDTSYLCGIAGKTLK